MCAGYGEIFSFLLFYKMKTVTVSTGTETTTILASIFTNSELKREKNPSGFWGRQDRRERVTKNL